MNPFQSASSAVPNPETSPQTLPDPSGGPEPGDDRDMPEALSAESAPADDWKVRYDTLYDQHVRLAADFDNFRKRALQERDALLKYGSESTLERLIPVLDNLERALGSLNAQSDAARLFEGMTLMQRHLLDTLTQLGLSRIEALGQPFDPAVHEAAGQTPTPDVPENHVLAEARAGYRLHERVLRPALVMVAAPPDASVSSGNPFTDASPKAP